MKNTINEGALFPPAGFPWPSYTAKGSVHTYKNCVVAALRGFDWTAVRNPAYRDEVVKGAMKAPNCRMHSDAYVPNKRKLAEQVVEEVQGLAKGSFHEGVPAGEMAFELSA